MEFLEKNGIRLHQFGIEGRKVIKQLTIWPPGFNEIFCCFAD
jgi:hypothetical protein